MRSVQLANEDLSGGGRGILLSAAVFSCSTPHDRTLTRRERGNGNHGDSLFFLLNRQTWWGMLLVFFDQLLCQRRNIICGSSWGLIRSAFTGWNVERYHEVQKKKLTVGAVAHLLLLPSCYPLGMLVRGHKISLDGKDKRTYHQPITLLNGF